MWLRVDAQALRDGLYGYNAVLVGLALPTFLQPSPLLWAYVVLGGAVSVVATLATANLIRTWHLSALTFPFVIVTWALLLAAFAFAGVGGEAPPYAGEVEALDPALSQPAGLRGLRRRGLPQHLAGLPEGQRRRPRCCSWPGWR